MVTMNRRFTPRMEGGSPGHDWRCTEFDYASFVQVWTHDRTLYLGHVMQKMLRGYTDAAVSITSNLLTIVSRFAVQVSVRKFVICLSS